MASNWNRRYGHKEILRQYAGRVVAPPIAGYLQHGWAPLRSFLPKPFVGGEHLKGIVPKLVWAERDLEHCREHALWPAEMVGAPFLYLLRLAGKPAEPDPRSLVAFPMHAVKGTAEVVASEWERYAEGLTAIEGYDRITVCLHPNDFANPDVLAAFVERDLQPTCNGRMEDPQFASRLYELLSRHQAATAGTVGTALFYAAMLGRQTFIHGRPSAIERRRPDGETYVVDTDLIAKSDKEEYPELFHGTEGKAAVEFARPHLGPERLLEPAELERAIGWRGPRRLAGAALKTGASFRRVVKRSEVND